MSKKSTLRLFRELRAAQQAHLIVYFDVDREPLARMIAQSVPETQQLDAVPVPAPQDEATFLRVVLEEHVSYDHARRLKSYILNGFENIERVVLTMKTQDHGQTVYPEIKIYTVRKRTLESIVVWYRT